MLSRSDRARRVHKMVCLAILWSSSSTSPEDGPVGEAFGACDGSCRGRREALEVVSLAHRPGAPLHAPNHTTPREQASKL
jgi:hypothetical protein